jgi:hypothetical protein
MSHRDDLSHFDPLFGDVEQYTSHTSSMADLSGPGRGGFTLLTPIQDLLLGSSTSTTTTTTMRAPTPNGLHDNNDDVVVDDYYVASQQQAFGGQHQQFLSGSHAWPKNGKKVAQRSSKEAANSMAAVQDGRKVGWSPHSEVELTDEAKRFANRSNAGAPASQQQQQQQRGGDPSLLSRFAIAHAVAADNAAVSHAVYGSPSFSSLAPGENDDEDVDERALGSARGSSVGDNDDDARDAVFDDDDDNDICDDDDESSDAGGGARVSDSMLENPSGARRRRRAGRVSSGGAGDDENSSFERDAATMSEPPNSKSAEAKRGYRYSLTPVVEFAKAPPNNGSHELMTRVGKMTFAHVFREPNAGVGGQRSFVCELGWHIWRYRENVNSPWSAPCVVRPDLLANMAPRHGECRRGCEHFHSEVFGKWKKLLEQAFDRQRGALTLAKLQRDSSLARYLAAHVTCRGRGAVHLLNITDALRVLKKYAVLYAGVDHAAAYRVDLVRAMARALYRCAPGLLPPSCQDLLTDAPPARASALVPEPGGVVELEHARRARSDDGDDSDARSRRRVSAFTSVSPTAAAAAAAHVQRPSAKRARPTTLDIRTSSVTLSDSALSSPRSSASSSSAAAEAMSSSTTVTIGGDQFNAMQQPAGLRRHFNSSAEPLAPRVAGLQCSGRPRASSVDSIQMQQLESEMASIKERMEQLNLGARNRFEQDERISVFRVVSETLTFLPTQVVSSVCSRLFELDEASRRALAARVNANPAQLVRPPLKAFGLGYPRRTHPMYRIAWLMLELARTNAVALAASSSPFADNVEYLAAVLCLIDSLAVNAATDANGHRFLRPLDVPGHPDSISLRYPGLASLVPTRLFSLCALWESLRLRRETEATSSSSTATSPSPSQPRVAPPLPAFFEPLRVFSCGVETTSTTTATNQYN